VVGVAGVAGVGDTSTVEEGPLSEQHLLQATHMSLKLLRLYRYQ